MRVQALKQDRLCSNVEDGDRVHNKKLFSPLLLDWLSDGGKVTFPLWPLVSSRAMAASSPQVLLASLDSHCRKGTLLIPEEKTWGLVSPFCIHSDSVLWFCCHLLRYFNKT